MQLRLIQVCLGAALLLALTACGPEAPQATGPAPTASRLLPTSVQRPAADDRPRPSGVTPVPPTPGTVVDRAASGDDPRALGDPAAPVTIVEYSDFQCPFCASFGRDTRPQIVQNYVQSGKVRFIHRDFPLLDIHPGALLAAHVANCAGDQGAFWPMHGRLFDGLTRGEWQSGAPDDFRTFLGYAAELQLDAAEIQRCVESNRHAARIEADMRDGIQAGVRSTPSFVVNGQLLVGAQPYAVWEQLLERLLSQQ
ncbi:MAG: DsbA family protein [Chloroflexi bacterium]|nr:DsbA family protein [Chloroflexota bacterium]